MKRLMLAAAASVLLLAANSQIAVRMAGMRFSPSEVTIVVGQSVTFINDDSMPHTVTATDDSFDSGDMAAGSSWTYTFEHPGTYTYGCAYHSWMHGTIRVVPR